MEIPEIFGLIWMGKLTALFTRTSSETGLTDCRDDSNQLFCRKTARELEKTTVMLIGISITSCAFFWLNIMARGITRPIEKTSNAMKKFAKGDFSVRLPEGRADEIGAMNLVLTRPLRRLRSC